MYALSRVSLPAARVGEERTMPRLGSHLGVGVCVVLVFCCVGPAQGLGPPTPGVHMARLKYGGGGDWYSNPTSLPNLARALMERTNIAVAETREVHVPVLGEDLFNYPFIYMNGHGRIRLTDAEAARLRQYLLSGGFLFADDNYGMDPSFRQMIRQVFPDRPLVEVPFDHPVYHSYYDFDNGPPKIHEHDGKPPQGFGIFDRGRLVVFYTYESDIGDGIEDPEVHHDPPGKREQAFKMAINVVMYALTGEKKGRPVSVGGASSHAESGTQASVERPS